jgi:putative DNA primase/helicase
MTGGGEITAHFMRQDDFTYKPQFKLFFMGNYKPGLRSVDEAIRARIKLIPFNYEIPIDDRDPQFPEKLREEWGGILQWIIDGCLAWQRDGFKVPDKIRVATNQYLEEEDGLMAWYEAKCDRTPEVWTGTIELFESYKRYREMANEFVGTMKLFSEKLAERSVRFAIEKKLHSVNGP